jgi:hypothetical protein
MPAGDFNTTWNNVNPGVAAAVMPDVYKTQQAIAMQPAAFARERQQNYGNFVQSQNAYQQALAGLGNSYANNYGAYASGLGNVAQAQANAMNNQNAQNGFYGMGEAARQGALGNMGSAALGAFGGASNAAQQAWAQNQMAYNKAMSDFGSANQTGLSQLGQSRNNAIGSLGNSYAKAGLGFGIASSLPGLFGGGGMGGGGGFQANGPDGQIASGSYDSGSSGAAPQSNGALSGMLDRTMAGLDAVRGDLNSTDIADRMDRNYVGGVNTLTGQHMSSRYMPSQMLNQTLAGLYGLNAMNLDASDRGMRDYYAAPVPTTYKPTPIDVRGVLSGLTYGYSDSADRLGGVQGQMGSAWNDNKSAYGDSTKAIDGMFDRTIGNDAMWKTPTQQMLSKRKSDLTAQLMEQMMMSDSDRRLSDFRATPAPVKLDPRTGRYYSDYDGRDTQASQRAKMLDALQYANSQGAR